MYIKNQVESPDQSLSAKIYNLQHNSQAVLQSV